MRTHYHTRTHSHLIAKHRDGRCLTVVHEYAEHISTVLTKDRSSLKSSTYPVFFSLSLSPITSYKSFYPCIYPPPPPSFSPSPRSLWLECQINAQVPTEGEHSLFLFPIIFNTELRVAMATGGAGMERKRGTFSTERERGCCCGCRDIAWCRVEVENKWLVDLLLMERF